MKIQTCYLKEDKSVRLDCYLYEPSELLPHRNKRPAVVVCPGGGYFMCAGHEADPVAAGYLAAGFHAFVLYYTVTEPAVAYPGPLTELCRAMKLIREHADEWGVIADQIALCGFSAGGHLAASLGVHWNEEEIKERTGCHHGENRPNALILNYPVISTSWFENNDALRRLIGDGDEQAVYRALNLHTCVNADTPQTFLSHTFKDNAVPVTDSMNFARALEKQNIPFEMHIFPNGIHGLSLATDEVCPDGGDDAYAEWFPLSVKWLRRLFSRPEEANAPFERAAYSSKL